MAEKGELMILIAVSQINTILAIAARKFGAGLMQCSTGIAKVRVRLPFRPLSRYCLVALIIVRIIYTFVPKNLTAEERTKIFINSVINSLKQLMFT